MTDSNPTDVEHELIKTFIDEDLPYDHPLYPFWSRLNDAPDIVTATAIWRHANKLTGSRLLKHAMAILEKERDERVDQIVSIDQAKRDHKGGFRKWFQKDLHLFAEVEELPINAITVVRTAIYPGIEKLKDEYESTDWSSSISRLSFDDAFIMRLLLQCGDHQVYLENGPKCLCIYSATFGEEEWLDPAATDSLSIELTSMIFSLGDWLEKAIDAFSKRELFHYSILQDDSRMFVDRMLSAAANSDYCLYAPQDKKFVLESFNSVTDSVMSNKIGLHPFQASKILLTAEEKGEEEGTGEPKSITPTRIALFGGSFSVSDAFPLWAYITDNDGGRGIKHVPDESMRMLHHLLQNVRGLNDDMRKSMDYIASDSDPTSMRHRIEMYGNEGMVSDSGNPYTFKDVLNGLVYGTNYGDVWSPHFVDYKRHFSTAKGIGYSRADSVSPVHLTRKLMNSVGGGWWDSIVDTVKGAWNKVKEVAVPLVKEYAPTVASYAAKMIPVVGSIAAPAVEMATQAAVNQI